MPSQPNILFITSDQHRGDTMGCSGHPCIRTPHLDQLAFEGVRFAAAHSDCPVCIPTRTTMITGIQSHCYGMPSYAEGHRIDRSPEKMLGGLMTSAGYQTQLIGKTHWHVDDDRAGFEGVLGYEEYYKAVREATGRYDGLIGLGGNEFYPTQSHLPPQLQDSEWMIDRSIEWMKQREPSRPFFLWVSLHAPHPPLRIHEPFYSMYDNSPTPEPVMPAWARDEACPRNLFAHRNMYNTTPMKPDAIRKARGVYYGMITHLDFHLLRLFSLMMRQGIWDETLVVYCSDHGEHLGDFGDLSKSNFMHTAAQIPFIIRPPRSWQCEPGRVSRALVDHGDLLPTFCAIGGAETPDDVTGRDLSPILRGECDAVRDSLHGQIDDCHMYHDGRYKYLYYRDDGSELVFDTINDSRDEFDLAGNDELRLRLRKEFIEHLASESQDVLPERFRTLTEDGDLLNWNGDRRTAQYWRSRNPLGWRCNDRF